MASSSNDRTPEALLEPAQQAADETPGRRFASHQELRIGEIVLAAAALEADQRDAFLLQLTTSEPGLLKEARRRLRQAAELPSAFLAVPAAELLEAATQAATPVEPPMPIPVTGADRYELQDSVGQGGMARVYKAFDRQLHRPVALKLLERADPKTLRRFLREAQAQARVRHEYVLEVYETGELGGQPFIAMYYVDGPTLMEIREETTLEQKVRLMAQVAEGLHAAHREGLLHRDVKPSNVLVEMTPDGKLKPWVADFGIATELAGGSSIWSAVLAGTPYYIAPERLDENHQAVDRRSDVYSLGVTFYQLLCGKLPFDDPSLGEMLRQVREDEPPSLRSRMPSVPAELDAVAMKCLAKDPEQRYATARAVADDLWNFLDGEAVEAHSGKFSYRLAKTPSYKKTLRVTAWLALAAIIASLLIFAVATTMRAQRVASEAVTTLDRLATRLHDQGRYEEAEELYLHNLKIREEHLGTDHPSVAQALVNFSSLLIDRGKYAEAEMHIHRALGILARTLPRDHWRRANADSVLAACLTGRGRFEEAEELLLASYPIVRGEKGQTSSYSQEIVSRLVSLYEAWGQSEQASHYRALLKP